MKLTKAQLVSIIQEHLGINNMPGQIINEFGGRPIVKNMLPWGPTHILAVIGQEPLKQLMKIKTFWSDSNDDGELDTFEYYESATLEEVQTAINKIWELYAPTENHDAVADISKDIEAAAKSLGSVMSLAKPFMPANPLLPKSETFGYIFQTLLEKGIELNVINILRSGLVELLDKMKASFPNSTLSTDIAKAGGSAKYLPMA